MRVMKKRKLRSRDDDSRYDRWQLALRLATSHSLTTEGVQANRQNIRFYACDALAASCRPSDSSSALYPSRGLQIAHGRAQVSIAAAQQLPGSIVLEDLLEFLARRYYDSGQQKRVWS